MRFAAGILESYLNKYRSDCQASQLRCECGALARYCGVSEKCFVTVVGRLRLRRAYYHCRVCGSGWFPKDKALGMTRCSVSAGMVRLIGLEAAHVSFAESSGLLRNLAGVRVSARTREMKLAVVWTAETTDEEGHRKADAMSTSYNAAIESARMGVWDKQLSAFAQRVERRGFYEAERQVVIGDGARWIWYLVDENFHRAVQIVDLYHAREKVWDVAKSTTAWSGLDRTMGTGAGETAEGRRYRSTAGSHIRSLRNQ